MEIKERTLLCDIEGLEVLERLEASDLNSQVIMSSFF